jgi:hypothetical protein
MNNNILNSVYAGHVKKNLKGGIKIINGSEDENILKKRDFILNDLSKVFKGGKELMYEDIPYYAQALEGKYIRNKICKGGNPQCKDACNLVKKSYKKLVKQSINEFNNPNLNNILKYGSPLLYNKLKGGNKYDKKVDDITNQISNLDDECNNHDNCKIKLPKLSILKNELNKAWVDSSHCQKSDDCFRKLSERIISVTPNIREFKENLSSHNSEVETYIPSAKEIIEKTNNTSYTVGGLYDYYFKQKGGSTYSALNRLRLEINLIRYS